jgi:putative oxidoreductase
MQGLEKLKPLALLLLRLALGAIFIFHGYPKLFTHTQEMMQFFARFGMPRYFVYASGILEFFGGILLIAGLFSRIVGLLLTGEIAVALWRVHGLLSKPLEVNNYEFPLAVAVGVFAIASIGPGLISLDHAIYREGAKSPRKARN